MKKFNELHFGIKLALSLIFLLVLIYILNWWVILINKFLLGILLIFVMVPITQFLITPLFTLLKFYTYYSPMLVVFGANKRVLNIHNGTSFDYLIEMRNVKPGVQWERKMLLYYLQGLIEISNQIESNKLPKSIIIRGSSYFFSNQTASRFNFEILRTPMLEKINLVLNYLDLFWSYSFSKGKIVFPGIKNIKTMRTTGEKLIQSKDIIIAMENHLNKNLRGVN